MKKTLVLIALMAVSALSAKAQGTVEFSNYGISPSDAPIFGTNGTTPLSTAYSVELYYAAGTVTDSSSLSLLAGSSSPILGSGFFIGGTKTLPLAGGSAATLQVRAWRTSDGASWAVASGTVGAQVGQSSLLTLNIGGAGAPPGPAALMNGLSSFSLYTVVPEPSTIALGVLAAGSLLFIRRRK